MKVGKGTIIPAESGYFALWIDEETGVVEKHDPIVAWQIIASGVFPVLAISPCEVGWFEPRGILFPDGRVIVREEGSYESLIHANDQRFLAQRKQSAAIRKQLMEQRTNRFTDVKQPKV